MKINSILKIHITESSRSHLLLIAGKGVKISVMSFLVLLETKRFHLYIIHAFFKLNI